MKKLWVTKFLNKEKSLQRDEKNAAQQALHGKFALYLLYSVATNLPEFKSCELIDTKIRLNMMDVSFMFRKGSQYKDLFNHEIQKMKENGELQRIIAKHSVTKENCNIHSLERGIGFGYISVVFLLLGCGALLSILGIAAEFAVHKIRNIKEADIKIR